MPDPIPAQPAPTSAADTITPWWADKAFLLVVANIVAVIVARAFHVQLDADVLAADASLVATYVVAHKVKSGKALLAVIRAEAERRYYAADPVPPLTQVASALDKPPAGP